jgi:hypothetical protein
MTQTGTIRWTLEDYEGLSPLGEPALLTFDVGFYFSEGSPRTWEYPGDDAEVQFCEYAFAFDSDYDRNAFDAKHFPGPVTAGAIEDWFQAYVESHDDEYVRMLEAAIRQLEEAAIPPERERD